MAADDSDDEETFVTYGTPVEILDEDAPRKKPTLIEAQVVTDKQGRRRFHGAFSGGFSAGYYNTVGSQKGWTPSTFVSSRSKKEEKKHQQPEDFMDEDDFGEYGIAPRQITTTDTYDQQEDRKKKVRVDIDGGVIPGHAPLQDLIQPNRESIGIRLLRKMGWRHGQGIGPRQKQRQDKVYGCAISQADGDQSSEDEYAQGHYFAPKDVESFKFRTKDNQHGIGYKGIDSRTAMFGGHEHLNLFEKQPIATKSSSGKLGMRGVAFGVGAFEDQDDDIYSTDHMSNYDQFIGDEVSSSKANKPLKSRFKDVSHISKLLDGFTLSANSRPPNKVYPAPELPRDFKPHHSMENVQPAGPKFTSKLFTMSAIQRGALLGEEQLPAPELKEIKKKAVSKVDPQETSKPSYQPPSTVNQQDIESAVASLVSAQRAKMESRFAQPSQPVVPESTLAPTVSGMLSFKPFVKDPAKQQRYEDFLKNKGKGSDTAVTDTMTEWERRREHDEFTRASVLYKPLSSAMASRFTIAKYADDDDSKVDVQPGQTSGKGEQVKAAEMKMFGHLTRNTFEWHPDRLLCKRFNIPDPYLGSSIIGIPTIKKEKASIYNFMSVPSWDSSSENQNISQPLQEEVDIIKPAKPVHPILQSGGIFSNFKSVEENTIVKEPAKTKSEEEEIAEEKRPSMDLFKAIFQDESSEDSDNSSDNESEEENKKKEEENKLSQEIEDQLKKSRKEISEIFQGSMTDNNLSISEPSSNKNESNDLPAIVETKATPDDMYGPALPPPPSESLYISKEKRESKIKNNDKNYKQTKLKRHVDDEKKHKHKRRKKEKHKSKHKKEKKHKHRSKQKHSSSRRRLERDSDSSTDSDSSDD
ncbi:G patch domain-containing protein 1-like isoform X2 [Antedon mediterranea]|uniref:G patch domain-containing protein 1-like isoform X2 n=1 Tax=Antedon mediterranea TaxID=105859 RepID=UPI003AF6D801